MRGQAMLESDCPTDISASGLRSIDTPSIWVEGLKQELSFLK